MLEKLIDDLFSNHDYDGKTVYLHNFSGFDSIFILKNLASNKFNICMKDGKIINLSVTKFSILGGEKTSVTINFNDSLLLLPVSLAKLGEGFGVALKGSFDHNKSNQTQNLNLIREELLTYNKQDCLVLHQVLTVFAKQIFDLFSVSIEDISTISSLALTIYKTKFMDKDARIPITDTKLYQKLCSGYTGGAVDVYVAQNKPGNNIYAYDINSLYPSVMDLYEYPIGTPNFIEGPVDLHDPDTFGFLRVKVTTPKDLYIPLLQTKIDGRTVAPLGTWTGWYFTEELKLAATLGYTFEVLEAVLFERGKVFSKYVSTLYKLRKSYSKDNPINLICKLLLNSLYGKFGMDPHLEKWRLVDKDSLLTAEQLPGDVIDLGDKMLVSSPDTKNTIVEQPMTEQEANNFLAKVEGVDIDELESRMALDNDLRKTRNKLMSKKPHHLDISLPIAMAVTAYARIQIYKFKDYVTKNGGILYYTDTDSIHASMPLPEDMVSGALGKMKMEYIACNAVFLAPKVYGVELFREEDLIKYKKDLIEGKYLIKIKGSKKGHGVNLNILDSLVVKESKHEIEQDKWYKSFTDSTVNIIKTIYTLKHTENKRAIIYVNNKFLLTMPFKIKDNVIISKYPEN